MYRLVVCLSIFFCFSSCKVFNKINDNHNNLKLYGYAADAFLIDSIVYEDKLNNQVKFEKDWIVQQVNTDKKLKAFAKVDSGKLHVHDPRGTTIWFKHKLNGPIMISYTVACPSKYTDLYDIMPRDINQFWMANTPNNIDPFSKNGLFDTSKYNGEFKTYDDLFTYYASTGGGNVTSNNKTIRMRRYPRSVNGKQVDHAGLNDKDEDSTLLIQSNKEHLVQLVAADDIIQYVFDKRVVYELKKGDNVNVFNDLSKAVKKAVWAEEPFTVYQSGYFAFRMTRTHHVYSNFVVHKLKKIK